MEMFSNTVKLSGQQQYATIIISNRFLAISGFLNQINN
ncbi:unnamed protein product [Brugia timori]|uniref:Uncharacterized protein n=1 Tax=Brugia timori TaxID=42155 RepID=A0A0R3QKJ6_9BILA|nr:unnamed protein product [Brugia timori]